MSKMVAIRRTNKLINKWNSNKKNSRRCRSRWKRRRVKHSRRGVIIRRLTNK